MGKQYIPEDPKPLSRAEELRLMTEAVKKELIAAKYNPVVAMIKRAVIMQDELNESQYCNELMSDETFGRRMSLEGKFQEVNKELASFIAPKLKAVDVTGSVDNSITVILGERPKQAQVENSHPVIMIQGKEEIGHLSTP